MIAVRPSVMAHRSHMICLLICMTCVIMRCEGLELFGVLCRVAACHRLIVELLQRCLKSNQRAQLLSCRTDWTRQGGIQLPDADGRRSARLHVLDHPIASLPVLERGSAGLLLFGLHPSASLLVLKRRRASLLLPERRAVSLLEWRHVAVGKELDHARIIGSRTHLPRCMVGVMSGTAVDAPRLRMES